MQQNHNPEAGRLGIFRSIHIDGEKTNRMTRRMIRLSSHKLSSQHPPWEVPKVQYWSEPLPPGDSKLFSPGCCYCGRSVEQWHLWWFTSFKTNAKTFLPKKWCLATLLHHQYLKSIWYPWNSPLESTSTFRRAFWNTSFPVIAPLAPSPTEPRFPPWPTLVTLSGPRPGLHKPPRRNRLGKPRFGNTWKIWMKQKGCLAKLRKQGEMSGNMQSIYLAEVSCGIVITYLVFTYSQLSHENSNDLHPLVTTGLQLRLPAFQLWHCHVHQSSWILRLAPR